MHPAASAGYTAKAGAYERGRPDYPPEVEGWLRGDLVGRRAELLDTGDREAGSDQRVQRGSDGPVMLDDPGRQPVGGSRPLHQILVQRPDPHAIRTLRPTRRGNGG